MKRAKTLVMVILSLAALALAPPGVAFAGKAQEDSTYMNAREGGYSQAKAPVAGQGQAASKNRSPIPATGTVGSAGNEAIAKMEAAVNAVFVEAGVDAKLAYVGEAQGLAHFSYINYDLGVLCLLASDRRSLPVEPIGSKVVKCAVIEGLRRT